MNPVLFHVIHQAFFGGIAAIGFAVLFNCRPPMLPFSFVSGVLALATRTLFQDNGFTLPTASFFAALLVAVIDRLWKETPSPRGSLLAFVGSIPMIPGGAAAKVIIGLFTVLRSGRPEDVAGLADISEHLVTLVFTLAAIGTALALPSLFQQESQRKRQGADD